MSFLMFLRKLVKIIRADTAPRQVGLGLAIGVLVGLPPFSLISLLLVLLFLLLNANLGAFLVAATVGGILRLLLAGVLEGIGKALLDNGALRGLWDFLLHLPVVSLSGYDSYLRFGATAAALVLAVAFYLLALVFVTPLRLMIERKAASSGFVQKLRDQRALAAIGRLLFGKGRSGAADEVEARGWIRKGFAVPFVLGVVGIVVFWGVAGPWITRQGIETVASLTTGKEFQVGPSRLAWLAGSLKISEVDVLEPEASADPEIADGKKIVLNLSPLSLLSRRFVIDELSLDNMTIYGAAEKDRGATDAGAPPQLPPDPPAGSKVGVEDIFEWVEAHESQLRWVLDKLDGLVSGPAAPGETPAPSKRVDARAAWVYAQRTEPAFIAREAAVRNLKFDWRDRGGPLGALDQLDLSLTGVSSHPSLHKEPIRFEATGLYAGKQLGLEGILDGRKGSDAGHDVVVRLASPSFAPASTLGLDQGKDLDLEIRLGYDRDSRALASATCSGSFSAGSVGQVKFDLSGIGQRLLDIDIRGIDLARSASWKRPDALNVGAGTLGLRARFAEKGSAIDGSLDIQASNLALAPGSRGEIAGIRAQDFCRAINELTKEQPLELRFLFGGTVSSPSVSLDESGLASLLEQAKTGLLLAGERLLADQLEQRLGPLRGVVDGKLDDKVSRQVEKLVKDPGAILQGGGTDSIEEAGKRLGGQLEKSLGGLFGSDDDKDKEKNKNKSKNKQNKNKQNDGGGGN